MSQASDSNNTPATTMETAMESAKSRKPKGAPKQSARSATPQAPVRQFPAQHQRTVITFASAVQACPTAGMTAKISRVFGMNPVDYDGIRTATERQMAEGAKVLTDNLSDKALQMHMQRIVDAYVRVAHGAGNFYEEKAKVARDLLSKVANEDRDEDRPGVDGTSSRADRAREFAATVALQAYAQLAAAHGAVDAYAHVCGEDWKPYAGSQAPSQHISRQAASMQMAALSRE